MYRLQMKRKNSIWKFIKEYSSLGEALEERDRRKQRAKVTEYRVVDDFAQVMEYKAFDEEKNQFVKVG